MNIADIGSGMKNMDMSLSLGESIQVLKQYFLVYFLSLVVEKQEDMAIFMNMLQVV